MALNPKNPKKICIICKKRKKRLHSLFCAVCKDKDVFIKIEALRRSKEYTEGWLTTGMPQRGGRLPQRL